MHFAVEVRRHVVETFQVEADSPEHLKQMWIEDENSLGSPVETVELSDSMQDMTVFENGSPLTAADLPDLVHYMRESDHKFLCGDKLGDESSDVSEDVTCVNCKTLLAKARIAELNDLARTAMGVCSRLIVTPGFKALSPAQQSEAREAVENFSAFTPDNDPYGEHDFGKITLQSGESLLWKIDYYDKALEYGSEHPEDPGQTTRVLTIMLVEEY